MKFRKHVSGILALAILLSVATGCSKREPADAQDGDKPSSSASRDNEAASGTVGEITPDVTINVVEMKKLNEDTVGWVSVPGTDISDVVVQNTQDNDFYTRRGFDKEPYFNGVYYVDFRADMSGGKRDELPVNTTIYGHSLTDDPEHENYSVKFAQLHDFRDPELAKKMPYILFSTEEESMAFEVFSVFVANCDNPDLPYNNGSIDGESFVKMFEEQVKPREYYHYDVDISKDDKFVVLSTCIYQTENGATYDYTNTWMRYVVMGKLVDPDEPLKTEASFTINEDMVFDPDGRWKS